MKNTGPQKLDHVMLVNKCGYLYPAIAIPSSPLPTAEPPQPTNIRSGSKSEANSSTLSPIYVRNQSVNIRS